MSEREYEAEMAKIEAAVTPEMVEAGIYELTGVASVDPVENLPEIVRTVFAAMEAVRLKSASRDRRA